jgi:hypothetical protein
MVPVFQEQIISERFPLNAHGVDRLNSRKEEMRKEPKYIHVK